LGVTPMQSVTIARKVSLEEDWHGRTCNGANEDCPGRDSSAAVFDVVCYRDGVLVEELQAEDIPLSGRRILSDLIFEEFAKADSFNAVREESAAHDIEKTVTTHISRLGRLFIIEMQIVDVASGAVEKRQTSEFTGELEQLRRSVRAAAQSLIGIGGFDEAKSTFIDFVSRPTGARVYLGNLFEGRTPFVASVDTGGMYDAKLTYPGYVD